MIKPPTINIDIDPMVRQLRGQIDAIKDEQKNDLQDLKDIVNAKKKQMADTINLMNRRIDDRKAEFNEFRDDWNKHDTKWKINHSPEFQRRTIVFLKEVEMMEAAVKKYAESTPIEITNYMNKKQAEIISRTEIMVGIIEKQLNTIADDAKAMITDTLKSLIPPIKIPADLLNQ